MKKISFTLLCLILVTLSLAQKVDLDREYFKHNYRRLPDKVLDPTFMTYSVRVNKTVSLEQLSNDITADKIDIEGRKYVDQRAHINVLMELGDLIIESSEVKERVEIKKDKDGKETGRSYFYFVEVLYSFEAYASVEDYQGAKMSVYTLANRKAKNSWTTSEYAKSSDAANYYNNNKLAITSRFVKEKINGAVSSLNSSLSSEFGYATINTNEILWKLGSKKHVEFEAYNQAVQSLKSALESMSPNTIPANVNETTTSAIDYFTQLVTKYNDPKDKGNAKLRYGANMNLAYFYLHTEQFDKAVSFAEKVIANDYDGKDGKKVLDDINNLHATFVKHGIKTQHFQPDFEDALPPN